MKKEYVKPTSKVVVLDSTENLLESSYLNIGGKTNSFGVNSRWEIDYAEDDDNEEEDDLW